MSLLEVGCLGIGVAEIYHRVVTVIPHPALKDGQYDANPFHDTLSILAREMR